MDHSDRDIPPVGQGAGAPVAAGHVPMRGGCAGALLLLVALIAIAVRVGALLSLDRALLLAAEPGPVLLRLAEAVTWFGDSATRIVIAAAAGLLLLLRRGWRQVLTFVAIVAGGAGANSAIKALIHRPRPDLLPHLDAVTSFSFPSGHAANSMILYVSLALLAPPRYRPAALSLALTGVLAIGMSRVVLAVHWPSDVAAGWAFGAGWLMLWNQSRSPARPVDQG